MSDIIPKIGKNIRKYRVKRGLSQDKLSKLAGISHIAVVKIELGAIKNPSIGTVVKIARGLGVDINRLL